MSLGVKSLKNSNLGSGLIAKGAMCNFEPSHSAHLIPLASGHLTSRSPRTGDSLAETRRTRQGQLEALHARQAKRALEEPMDFERQLQARSRKLQTSAPASRRSRRSRRSRWRLGGWEVVGEDGCSLGGNLVAI